MKIVPYIYSLSQTLKIPMSNFTNYPAQFEFVISSAKEAEKYIYENLDIAGLYLRKTLETWVKFIYESEPSLRLPYDTSINDLMKEPAFIDIIDSPELLSMMHAIRQLGNKAVHNTGKTKITEDQALHVLQLLHSVSYYLMTLYSGNVVSKPLFQEELIPPSFTSQVSEQNKKINLLQEELKAKTELEKKQKEEQQVLEANRKETQQQILPPTDPDEAKTRELLIDYMLEEMGWDLSHPNAKEFRVEGMPNNKEEENTSKKVSKKKK